jgi:hypothetical protein
VHDLAPILAGPPFGLAPVAEHVLDPERPLRQRVRLAAPSGRPGTYRCRAMYRPEDQAPSVSGVHAIELAE